MRFSPSPSLGLVGSEMKGGRERKEGLLPCSIFQMGLGKKPGLCRARNLSRSQGERLATATANLTDWVIRGDMGRNNSLMATFLCLPVGGVIKHA